MRALAQYCSVVLLIATSVASFGGPYEIPRSSVVELVEPSTKRTYSLFIKVPRSYASNKDRRYPVIYLTDAPSAFQLVSGATHYPMNSGSMNEAIIVGLSYADDSSGLVSRVRDYTPVKARDWKRETGQADRYIKFIRDGVFTYISENFRVENDSRTFVGHSLGGLLGTHILFTQPDLFSSYIISSPSIWYHSDYILSQSAIAPAQSKQVYLSVGSRETPDYGEAKDMVAGAAGLRRKLTEDQQSHIRLKFEIHDGATHATSFPTAATQGLDWIYGKN